MMMAWMGLHETLRATARRVGQCMQVHGGEKFFSRKSLHRSDVCERVRALLYSFINAVVKDQFTAVARRLAGLGDMNGDS
jgi:hypothetical protein